MNEVQFTFMEREIIEVVRKMLGKSKEAVVFVEDITKHFIDPDDDDFEGRNKSMLANMRHLSIKSLVSGPIVITRDAPIKNGRPVTNGHGNKAAYIARKRN